MPGPDRIKASAGIERGSVELECKLWFEFAIAVASAMVCSILGLVMLGKSSVRSHVTWGVVKFDASGKLVSAGLFCVLLFQKF